MRGRKVIVTGASPGSIGLSVAQSLARWGAEVVITSRAQPEALAKAAQADMPASALIAAARLDLTDRASVKQFVQHYRAEHGEQLDVLVNNAGIHLDLLSRWKSPRMTGDGYELHWRTNYLGSFDLTQQLLPMLLATAETTGDARIVNTVSQLHSMGRNPWLFEPMPQYNSWRAYGLSKLALMHMSQELHRRHAAHGLKSYSLHPGAVYSNIANKGLDGASALLRLRRALAPIERFFLLNLEEGAQTSLYCASNPLATSGQYFNKCAVARASADLRDDEVSQRLWAQTEAWFGSSCVDLTN